MNIEFNGKIWFWSIGGYLSEGGAWLERALAHSATLPAALRAKALNAAGHFASEQIV